MAFPDPSKPIATCAAPDCEDCPAAGAVQCHFRLKHWLFFAAVWIPGFAVGVAGVLPFGVWPLVGWGAVMVAFFVFLETRVLCSHCPHYAERGWTLSCWANHGIPKLWRYRPGPTSVTEKLAFLLGLVAVFGYPVIFLATGRAWLLLALYVLGTTVFFAGLKLGLCRRCMNFACFFNSVNAADRALFFERNPSVARHWDERRRD